MIVTAGLPAGAPSSTNLIKSDLSFNSTWRKAFMQTVHSTFFKQILIALCCCIALQTQAQAPQNTQKKSETTLDAEKQLLLKQIELQSETIKGLEKKNSEERQLLEGQLDRHLLQVNKNAEVTQKPIDRTVQIAIAALGVIVAVGIGIFGFLFGKRLTDVKEELDNRSKQLLERSLVDVDAHIKKAMGDKLTETLYQIDKVKSVLDEFSAYKQRKFVWLLLDQAVSVNLEVSVLEREGIKNIHCVFIDLQSPFVLPDCDVIIFSHDGSSGAVNTLNSIVVKIHEGSTPIFLIVYTFVKGKPIRLEPHQMEPLKDFRWYQLASFPMTLITVAKNLVR